MGAFEQKSSPASVLVLGRNGMLGQTCMRRLAARSDWLVEGTQRDNPDDDLFLDAERGLESVAKILAQRRYEYAINCIGLLQSAIDENDSRSVQAAIRINALFPHQLALAASAAGVRVIHISTDGVFSGTASEDYTEASPLDCIDTYGKTKALGECHTANVLNIRCSILGRDALNGKGLIEWFLRTPPGTSVAGFTDYCWSAVTTWQFAELCERIIERNAFERLRQESSVHHFAPNAALSKYDFLVLLESLAARGIRVEPGRSPHGPARRVLSSRLTSLRQLYQARGDWSDVLGEALR